MDELHAAIAAHLRAQQRPLTPEESDATPRVGRLVRLSEAAILNIWRAHRAVPHCNICGAPVDDEGGLYNLANMRDERECVVHYAPF